MIAFIASLLCIGGLLIGGITMCVVSADLGNMGLLIGGICVIIVGTLICIGCCGSPNNNTPSILCLMYTKNTFRYDNTIPVVPAISPNTIIVKIQ